MSHQFRVTLCAPVSDDPTYFAEVSVDTDTGKNYTWAEIYLVDVDVSAKGPRRLDNAKAVVRMWFGDEHFDVPYSDVVAMLERARTRLLVGESHIPPE